MGGSVGTKTGGEPSKFAQAAPLIGSLLGAAIMGGGAGAATGGGVGSAATYPYGTSFGGQAPWMGP